MPASKVAAEIQSQRHVAIDGETLRRSFDNFLDRRAAHMHSAFATDTALVLARLDCDEKSLPAAQCAKAIRDHWSIEAASLTTTRTPYETTPT
jgi:hypothetical protein